MKQRFSMRFALAVLSLFFWIAPLGAADDPEIDILIKSYVNATDTGDLNQIKTAWNDLNNNPDAVAYMQKNYPQLHYLFQVRGLYFQVSDIKVDSASTQTASTEPVQNALDLQESAQPEPVVPFSVSGPEADRLPTNGEIVERSKNAKLPDNREVALSNPNQNRQDNKTILENRVQGFNGQKFQKAPDVLVPAGTTGTTGTTGTGAAQQSP